MRRFVLAASLAAALLTFTACGSSPSTGDPVASETPPDGDSAITSPELSKSFTDALQGTGMPSGVVVVLDRDGSLATASFNSLDEATPTSTSTIYAYRSITKTFTGTVVLQLADEGLLSISDPISKYVQGVPDGDKITIDDLARMRSGLANYSSLPALSEAMNTRLDDPIPVDTMLEWAYAASPNFAPGTQFEYSNTNTLLLGKVIEKVTGNSWFDEVDTRILQPLKLESVHDGFSGGEDEATGYQLTEDGAPEALPVIPPQWFGAAGALTGDALDLAKWGEALGTGSLVSPDTQLARVESLTSTAGGGPSPEYDNYGFAMGEIQGWIGHTGNGIGFECLVMHDPASGRTISMLLNGTGSDGDVPAHTFLKMLPMLEGETS